MHPQIRPIAICVFWKGGNILVAEGYDSWKREKFYRPLGGSIEFGEYSRDCIIREIREELGSEINGLTYIGTIENLFVFNGKVGHEIVLVYEASFVDRHMYDAEAIEGRETDGTTFVARWKPVVEFREGKARLVPEGLLNLLDKIKKAEHIGKVGGAED